MPFEGEGDDEGPSSHQPLPPEDRLWRHPSELAGGTAGPSPWPLPGQPQEHRGSRALVALAGAGLAGALVAVGVMWVTRPTRVVVEEAEPTRARTMATAAFAPAALPAKSLADRLAPTLVQVEASQDGAWTAGTGIRLDDRGTIAVATPLVDGASTVMVTDHQGDRVPAIPGASDAATGITIVTVASTGGAVVPTRSVDASAGEPVAVIGAASVGPDGATEQRVVTASVSAVGLRSTVGPIVLHDAVQLDRAVPADTTGGLVVSGEGKLVGLVLAGSGSEDLAIVVPADDALAAAKSLRDDGEVRRAWLGVRATDLTPTAAAMLDVKGGAQLTAVEAGSPAAAAGLRKGDVITSVDGRPVGDASDLVVALRAWEPGEQVAVGWHRGTKAEQADVVLGG
jgi:S1-C subfamily serine protease